MQSMETRHILPLLLLSLMNISQFFRTSHGDVGTAAQYSTPYLPTECYGTDSSQFPTSNLFAAAGEGIWDNGASCGRQYQVRCISAAVPGDLCSGEDYSYQDCGLHRLSCLLAVSPRYHHNFVADGVCCHCQFHRCIHQH